MIGVDEKERRSGGWHPRILAFFVAAALGLSVGASLDCKFLTVELPFVPEGYRGRELSFGLWSYEAPRGGECLSLGASHRSGGFARDDDIYSNAFINHDTNWSTARCLAISCALFGSTALVRSRIMFILVACAKLTSSICQCFPDFCWGEYLQSRASLRRHPCISFNHRLLDRM